MRRIFVFLLLSITGVACVPVYTLTSTPASFEREKPMVSISPVLTRQSPFQRLRFLVEIHNLTNQPQSFSTAFVSAELNNQPAVVLTYQAQRQELESIILYYQPVVQFHPAEVVTYSRFGAPQGVTYRPVGFDAQMDFIDLQLALDGLDYLEKHAVRPVEVQPGERYQGEITLLNKLDERAEQKVDLSVNFAGQLYRFVVKAQRQSP